MLSQERGPKAALRYLRERKRLTKSETPSNEQQEVVVLRGGFGEWQAK
jgi:hypothetical protein